LLPVMPWRGNRTHTHRRPLQRHRPCSHPRFPSLVPLHLRRTTEQPTMQTFFTRATPSRNSLCSSSISTAAMSHSEFGRGATGIHTVEGNQAGARAAKLTQKREQDQKEYEAKKVCLVLLRVVICVKSTCLPYDPPSLPYFLPSRLPSLLPSLPNTTSARSKTILNGPWVDSTRNSAASNRPHFQLTLSG